MFDDLNPVSLKVANDKWYCKTPSPEGTAVCDLLVDLARRIDAGEDIYFGVTDGEYAGSIFRFEPHENSLKDRGYNRGPYWAELMRKKAPYGRQPSSWTQWQWDAPILYGRMRFNKRKNNPSMDVRVNGQCVYLPNYDGPTVYKKFDRKAAEQALMEEIEIRDRNGVVLAEGDSVIYVNLRYGSGGQLDYGTIREIRVKAKADPRGKKVSYEVNVVVTNRDVDEESTIRVPAQLIIKEMK